MQKKGGRDKLLFVKNVENENEASYRIDRLPVMGESTADFTLFDEFVYWFCLLKKICRIKG